MRLFSTVVTAAMLVNASMAFIQTAQFRPSDEKGISYSVNVPPSTASRGQGPIYFQMEAPSDTTEWFALGQGTGMAGANIFVAYISSDKKNITISPRLGRGHMLPDYNPSAQVRLLEGSGISNGKIIAKVLCESCMSWDGGSMNPTDTKSPWIWAVKRGNPLNSADVEASIPFHDNQGTFTFDLTVDANRGDGSSGSTPGISQRTIDIKRVTHGIIMSVVFVILFPTFALTLFLIPYSKTATRIHAPLQILTLCAAVTGFGVGVSLGLDLKRATMYHPIIGYVVIGWLLLFQPLLGYWHHLNYVRTRGPSAMGLVHRWVGRSMLVLGIINGGLGFKFSGIGEETVPKAGVIVYAILAGVISVAYIIILMWGTSKKKKNQQRLRSDESFFDSENIKLADGRRRG
ncbi:integral membrane protein [Histoplasma ohiense]|nr:integral membrane protein [Histoplasma ohiense (nom. inval.)]